MTAIFFYGSLRDTELLEVVLGRPVADSDLVAGIVRGYATEQIEDEAYPVLMPSPGAEAAGVLVRDLGNDDMARLAFFEEAEYGLAPITVETAEGSVEASYFLGTDKTRPTGQAWDYAGWRLHERVIAIEAARELMAYFGTMDMAEIDTVWHGIMFRARMRARAMTEVPVAGTLRATRQADDVETIGIGRPYTRYFAIEEHRLRHRQFDGSMSNEIARTVIVTGDAVTLLPFDPVTDRVLLIEQFRAPVHARGDRAPWVLEVIAGRIDQDGDAEATARREAFEEAGLSIGQVERIAGFYATPGFAAEHVSAFVGQADLSDAGGVFGVATENEDIRAFVVGLDEALAGMASGEINTAPAIMSLMWLQVHRDRLRRMWGKAGSVPDENG